MPDTHDFERWRAGFVDDEVRVEGPDAETGRKQIPPAVPYVRVRRQAKQHLFELSIYTERGVEILLRDVTKNLFPIVLGKRRSHSGLFQGVQGAARLA